MYKKYFKRTFDIVCALLAIFVFSWLYIIVAVLVKIKLGSPVIFKQKRPGLNGHIFTLYKFRTMTDATDQEGKLLPDDVRLTKFGKRLRSTSLDELPEAFNILKGDMSVVGPRPLLVKYLPRYTERQYHRHDVRPGLSGIAQVEGRNSIPWDVRFELDVKYTEEVSFALDCKIIFKTIWLAFVKRNGISGGNSETMDEFMGTLTENYPLSVEKEKQYN